MTPEAPRPAPFLLTRLVTVVLALAVAGALVYMTISLAILGGRGYKTLVDVLMAPVMFVFYAGPPLLVIGMASRSRSRWPAALALFIAVMMALGLQVFSLAPWHHAHWHDHLADAGLGLGLSTIFVYWPLVAAGSLLWLALNRRK